MIKGVIDRFILGHDMQAQINKRGVRVDFNGKQVSKVGYLLGPNPQPENIGSKANRSSSKNQSHILLKSLNKSINGRIMENS